MRKEDKRQIPPRLKVRLPEGFHLERRPREYVLYFSYPVVDSGHHQKGVMTDLVCVFTADTSVDEIQHYAEEQAAKFTERLKH